MTGRDPHDPGPDRPYDFAAEIHDARTHAYDDSLDPWPDRAPSPRECAEDDSRDR